MELDRYALPRLIERYLSLAERSHRVERKPYLRRSYPIAQWPE
jgi:hypothetical protein